MAKKDQAYYQDLLSQHINGSISKEGRFELEKHALDDPFLFEALEGYNNSVADDKKAIINKLKEKTQQAPKSKTARRVPLMNYGIAASLVLILGVGLWFFNQANTVTEQIVHQTSTSDERAMPSPAVIENESMDLNLDVIEDQKEEANLSAGIENKSNNQYDSPKAKISQTEVEETIERSDDLIANTKSEPPGTTEESTITLIQDEQTDAGIAESKIEEREDNNSSIAGQAAALKTQATLEPSSRARKMEQTKEEVLEESVDPPSVLASNAEDRSLRLDRDQYLLAQDQSTLVAPDGGITTFKNLITTITGKLKSNDQSSNEKVIISFSLSKEGRPNDFDILSGKNQACINMIVSSLKHGVDWITEPPNTEAKVELRLSCN